MSEARGAWLCAALLASLACRPQETAPAAPPLAIVLHEPHEIPLLERPNALLDTANGLFLMMRDDDGERVWVSRDDGASWSGQAVLPPVTTRAWAVDESSAELHRLEAAADGLFHARGLAVEGPRTRIAGSDALEVYSVAVGSGGRLGVVWIDRSRGWPELMFSRSTDHGASWSPPLRVNTESRRKEMAQPTLLSHRGGWVVTWAENRDPHTLFDLYGSFSADGQRWGRSHRLNDDHAPSFSVGPTAVEDGRVVHVLAQDYREVSRFKDRDANVYYARMDVSAAGPVRGVRVNDVRDGPQWAPILARDAPTGVLVAAWLDSRHRLTGDIYVSTSADGGASWSRNRRVNVNGRPELVDRPWLTHRRAGGVFILWQQAYGSVKRTWLRRVALGAARDALSVEEPLPAPHIGPLIDPPPSRRLLAFERFDEDSLGSFAPRAGSWIVHDGALLGIGYTTAFAEWTGPPLADFALEGRFRLDRREHLGAHVFLRMRGSADDPATLEGYHVRNHFRMGALLSHTRLSLAGDQPPRFLTEPLSDRWFPLRAETWYEFRVVVSGNRLDYWLDGRWMLSEDGLDPGAGRILLASDAGGPVEWDDLRVYALEE